MGWTLGGTWALSYLVVLVPVGVALSVIDLRTRMLPTRLIAPAYLVTISLMLAPLVVQLLTGQTGTREWDLTVRDLLQAGCGWASMGLLYLVLWFVTRTLGYGDVRLAGLVGLALGYLGWAELASGVWFGFLLGGVGWVPLRVLGVTTDRHLPYGPFMLAGAWVGVVAGGPLWALVLTLGT